YSKASSAGLDIKQEGSGEALRYRLQKKNSIFRFCFSNPDGTPSDWIGRPDSTVFCGHFNRRSAAAKRGSDSPAPAAETAECIPRPAALRRAASGDRSSEDYDSGSQGVHEGGSAEFRGIHLAPSFLHRIDRFQQDMQALKSIPQEALFHPRDFDGGVVSFK